MSQHALLRSVKGLGIPGTARKEDRKTKLKVAVPAPAAIVDEDRKDHFATRNGVRCAGVHLIVDLHGAERLDDIEHIEATLRDCVSAARATLLHIHLHHFQPSGVSGVQARPNRRQSVGFLAPRRIAGHAQALFPSAVT